MSDPSAKTAPVAFSELRDAFDFVSAGDLTDHAAYICRSTGELHWLANGIDPEEEGTPEDIEESDDYLSVPDKRDLDLGNRLVFRFAEAHMPDDCGDVRDIFRRRGAYRRFRHLLEAKGLLDRWYQFEDKATDRALRDWCEANDVTLKTANPS